MRSIYIRNSQVKEDGTTRLYKEIARLNHSCLPNSELIGNVSSPVGKIFTIRYVKKGEELTLDYGKAFWTYAERRKFLKEIYQIDQCRCRLCSRSKAKREESDRRRTQLSESSRALTDFLRSNATTSSSREQALSALATAELMIRTLEKEDIRGSEVIKIYEPAWRAARAVGQHEKARRYAAMVLELGEQLGAFQENETARRQLLQASMPAPAE